MRVVASAVIAAVLLGLVPAEFAALGLATLALIVSGFAYGIAVSVRRSFREAIDIQSSSARALVSAARDVDSKIRDV